MSTQTLTYVAARSRAHGPTLALWHAVELHRAPAEVDDACELTVCGELARVTLDQLWPATNELCPTCARVTTR